MQNQPFTSLNNEGATGSGSADTSQGRLILLAACLILVAILISFRVYYVQAVIPHAFLEPWGKTTVVTEPIPARNGRILSRDGVVLAYDETHYDISLEYRWLEQPFDEVWLRRKVNLKLSPTERDNPDARLKIEHQINNERNRLIQRLANLSGEPVAELELRAKKQQQKIERMVASVERKRAKDQAASEPKPLNLDHGIQGVAKTIRSELITPPRRFAHDPIILKEELESHVLIENVPLKVVATIQSAPTMYPGVEVTSKSARVYPLEDLAAHLLGLRKKTSPSKETVAQGGIEQQYNDELAGKPGEKAEKRNRQGEIIESEVTKKPVDGKDIVLSLDSRLQLSAEKLLDEALESESMESQPIGGVVIIMNLWTGDILTAAAAPRYSLQTMLSPTQEKFREIQESPNQPFFSRVNRMALPPGSVFKIVTAAAGLESGEVSPDELLECRGYLNTPNRHRCQIFRNYGLGHGEIHLDDALCQSCNVFFYDIAQRVGPEPLIDWSRRFGFGMKTGIDLPSEESGFLPHPDMKSRNQKWFSGSELQLAIGQGALLATPLQVTRLMGAIGNGGYLVQPRIVLDRSDSDRDNQHSMHKIDGLTERTITTIRHGMEMVVHNPRGTGTSALTPSMTIAGKTGTAEVDGQSDHAWFAGFAPVDSPRIAFCVVLEHGGSGGETGPIIREIMTELIGLGYLLPQWDNSTTQQFTADSPQVASSQRSAVTGD